MFQTVLDVLAQAAPSPDIISPGGSPGPTPGLPHWFWAFVLATVVFYLFLFRGQGRKQKEMEKMIQSLKKNDRVVTIGGIVGTVVGTKNDEVVLRVDEASNTKITFVRKAIQRVLAEEPGAGGKT